MSPRLRIARDADIEALIAFWLLAGENDLRPGDSREAVERLIERDATSLLIADDAGEIVGTVIAGWDGWRAGPSLPSGGASGASATGHRRAAARCRRGSAGRLGARRLDAMVLDGNDLGQSAWRAHGYERQTAWSRWVKSVGGSTT